MNTDGANGEEAKSSLLNSANDNVFSSSFTPVRWLILNKGATRIKRKKERVKPDELWQGDAFDPQRPDDPALPVYVRVGNGGAIVAELVCGCIARALGLPAPEVFIVTVAPSTLKGSKLADKSAYTVCVATLDLGGETFTQLLNDDDDAAVELLHQWAELNKVVAFDEWTANPDRNMGNLIYAACSLHIIDHAEAFGGLDGSHIGRLTEHSEQMFDNRLADMLNLFNAGKRNKVLKEVQLWLSTKAAALDLSRVVALAGTDSWNNTDQDQELVDFLKHRLTVTHSLLCHRLGHPQLGLKQPPI